MAIKTKFSVDNDFWDDIAEDLDQIILDQLRAAQGEIKFQTGQLIERFLQKHQVYKGLIGDYAGDQSGLDLQAEFGLTETMALDALEQLITILQKSVIIDIEKQPKSRVVGITLTIDINDSYKNKVNGAPFEYVNTSKNGTNTTIYWMKFLLDAANSFIEDYILNVDEYGIVFRQSENSRSGRATMTIDETKTDRFPYVLNKRYVSFQGDNFIEDMIDSKEFKTVLLDVVEKAVKDIG